MGIVSSNFENISMNPAAAVELLSHERRILLGYG
jgi:hypothetical protein